GRCHHAQRSYGTVPPRNQTGRSLASRTADRWRHSESTGSTLRLLRIWRDRHARTDDHPAVHVVDAEARYDPRGHDSVADDERGRGDHTIYSRSRTAHSASDNHPWTRWKAGGAGQHYADPGRSAAVSS